MAWADVARGKGRGGIKHGFVFLSLSFFVISKTHIVRGLCGGECHFCFKAVNITDFYRSACTGTNGAQ